MKTVFEYKKFINNKGYFAKVSIQLMQTKSQQLEIICEKNTKWFPAIVFAANYFYEEYSKRNKEGLLLKIINLETMIVDTSLIVVFYVVVRAMAMALDFNQLDDMNFDQKGNLIVPK